MKKEIKNGSLNGNQRGEEPKKGMLEIQSGKQIRASATPDPEDEPVDSSEIIGAILNEDSGYASLDEEHEEPEQDDSERTRQQEDENGTHDN